MSDDDEVNCSNFIWEKFHDDPSKSSDHPKWPLFLMVVLCISYLPVFIIIYRNRRTQAVQFKSPMMILMGGVALFFDSLVNVILKLISQNETGAYIICALSVLTTCTSHYIAFFSLIYRAQRIFKVIDIENDYLEKMYEFLDIDAKRQRKDSTKKYVPIPL